MSFRQDKPVTFLPMGILGSDLQFLEIQDRQDIRGGQRSTGMTRLGLMDHCQDCLAQFLCLGFKLLDHGIFLFILYHESPPIVQHARLFGFDFLEKSREKRIPEGIRTIPTICLGV